MKNVRTETNEKGCHLVTSHKPTKDGHVRWGNTFLHRVVYENHFGEIPKGMVVRHTCDCANCINPDHLILGTHADNVKDRVERDRSAKGSKNGRAKLTEENVRYIRNSEEGSTYLARRFNVDPKAIRQIKQFKTWKHVI